MYDCVMAIIYSVNKSEFRTLSQLVKHYVQKKTLSLRYELYSKNALLKAYQKWQNRAEWTILHYPLCIGEYDAWIHYLYWTVSKSKHQSIFVKICNYKERRGHPMLCQKRIKKEQNRSEWIILHYPLCIKEYDDTPLPLFSFYER